MEGGFFVGDEGPGQGAPQPTGPAHTQHRAGCTRCSSLTWDQEWHTVFGLRLCNVCKRSEPLISKTTAKQRYHVTDADLKKLGSLRKSNPHKKDWQQMHLYVQSQVEKLSHERHGGAEGLADYEHHLRDQKFQARIKKREAEKQREDQEAARRDRVKRRIQEEEEQRQQAQQEALQQQVDVEEI